MVVVNIKSGAHSLEVRGKLGRPNSLGNMFCGWSIIGDDDPVAGIYQRYHGYSRSYYTKNAVLSVLALADNFLGAEDIIIAQSREKGQIIVQKRHWICKNNQHENQQIWRGVFADGVAEWKLLTPTEKQYYNKLRNPARQSGFTRFMSRYLALHK